MVAHGRLLKLMQQVKIQLQHYEGHSEKNENNLRRATFLSQS